MTAGQILIIEDEVKLAELLRDYLKQDGFTVSCLHSGELAVDTVRRATPDLILLDLMLPVVDGLAICREIRRFSNVPIIMITARVEEIDRLIGLEIGADDYVCKPFSPREVVARAKAVLRRTRTPAQSQRLIAGEITLDEATRQVTVAGRALTLTPSEFGLLNVLLSAPGRVFSRNEFLDRVQGYRFDGYDRTIDSHVKNLRRKIGECLPDQDVIVTVYGIGYKLIG
ncbi:response regulator [Desulfofustis glycolicus]|uniref:Two-component system, OmpR family, response regulator BaeR n=1 Tax=Desulfofustis glycolicus DSM 9705 TaxID=1121409 RepID=A0A1M5YCU0_9BACT|nr:response regulator [Desulfofustis glycolicus]MCB2215538.1 response regulator [Desulfobulbaceae bacterium]SHI09880.1 two-component system, OmpR family, response regulator BaeR [Desulfofustis glycolicus DSM 9705]